MGQDVVVVPDQLLHVLQEVQVSLIDVPPPHRDPEMLVHFPARFELYLPYLNKEHDYKEAADAFFGALRPALISGAGILHRGVSLRPALVRAIVQLK